MSRFHAFRDERPKEEYWELVAGTPVLAPRRSIGHQRIRVNLVMALDHCLRVSHPEWVAVPGMSLLAPDSEIDNPSPDVSVMDAETDGRTIYVPRFYFVAEVVSPLDDRAVMDAKLKFYQSHASCLGIVLVEEDKISADLYLRGQDWTHRRLRSPDDQLAIGPIGNLGPLSGLYKNTHLTAT